MLPRAALEKGAGLGRGVGDGARRGGLDTHRSGRQAHPRANIPLRCAVGSRGREATFTSLEGSGDFFWPALLSLPVAFPVDGVLLRWIATGANRPDSLSRLRRPKLRAQATVDWISSREAFLAGSC